MSLTVAGGAWAQLPLIRLDRLYPPGGHSGSTVEVAVSGDNFEEVRALRGDDPGLKAEFVKQDGTSATFRLTVGAGVAAGTHDLRAVGRFGISNPLLFDVNDCLTEVAETEPNNLLAQANPVPVNCVISGTADNSGEDCFVWKARKGERVILDCFGSRLGNSLDATLVVLSKAGKELAFNRDYNGPDPLIDFTPPEDGEYVVRLYDANYNGGNPYRLRISTLPYVDAVFPLSALPSPNPQTFTLFGRNLPGGQPVAGASEAGPLQQLTASFLVPMAGMERTGLDFITHPPSTFSTVDAFQQRLTAPAGVSNPFLISLAQAPPLEEREPDDTPSQAQELAPPCEVNGRLAAPGDRDWFAVTLKAGQQLALEAYCERAGMRGDLFLLVQNAKGEDLAEYDDSGPNYNQRFNAFNRDPEGRFAAPADGKYFLLVADRYQRGGSRFLYRLRVSPPQPDYRAVVVHSTESIPSALLVLQGGRQTYDLILLRQDGFDGEVSYRVEGLPPGVTCPPGRIGAGGNLVPLVFTAAPDAPPGEAEIRVLTSAAIGDRMVEREARSVVQTVNNQAASRMARNIALAVRPSAAYVLTAAPETVTAAPGSTLEVKVTVQRRWPEFTGAVQVTVPNPPPGFNVPTLDLPAGQTSGMVKIPIPQNARPGNYLLALRGDAQVPFSKSADGKDRKDVRVTDPANAVLVTITAPGK